MRASSPKRRGARGVPRCARVMLMSLVLCACAPRPEGGVAPAGGPKTAAAPDGESAGTPEWGVPPERESSAEAPVPPALAMVDLFPHVRADVKGRVVEFDGIVPLDAHDPRTPDVYLEVVVCTPDTKEHEALVMTKALPSHVHAALLAIGLTPGRPGSWEVAEGKLNTVPPEGDAVEVTFITKDAAGHEVESRPRDWIVNRAGGPILAADAPTPFVFAGSRMATREGRVRYDADGTGTLVGLTTFGMETIAWREVLSHAADVTEPDWLADVRRVPKFGTAVTVRVRPAVSGSGAR